MCAEAGITPETEEEIREQIIGKNYFAAEAIMREKNIPDKYSELIVKVSEFIGSDDALEKAASQVQNERSLAAIKRLKDLYKVLTYYGVEKYISFDLGILSRFNYYTGVIFSAYTYGVGDAIAKGGRYDNLLGKYGTDAPAIGFSIIVDDLMSALYRQGIKVENNTEIETITYTQETFESALNKANALRNQGRFQICDLLRQDSFFA